MKRKILVVIVIFIIILIPIIVFGSAKLISAMSISNEKNDSIEYSKLDYSEEEFEKNRQAKKEMLEEYERRVENDPSLKAEPLTQEEEQLKKEMEEIKEQKQNENEEFMQKVLDIVGRFYPNELNKILQDAKAQEAAMTGATFVAILNY